MAKNYHQLGTVAAEQGDLASAREWYLKSLAIEKKLGNEQGAASTYHQLGRVAEDQRDFAIAREWYLKSLAIKEKQHNEHGAAITYHQLGMVAQKQRDFATAREKYLKALAITERIGDDHGTAIAHGQMGILADLEGRPSDACTWFLRSIHGFTNAKDPDGTQRNSRSYRIAYRRASEADRPGLRQLWIDAGHDPAFLDAAP